MSHPEHSRESLPLFAGSPTSLLPSSSMAEHTSDKREAGGSTPSSATNVPSGGFHQLPGREASSTENNRGSRTAQQERGIGRLEQAHARKSDGPNSHKAAQSVTNLGPVRDAILDILSMGDFTDSEIEQWYRDRQKTWGYPLSSPSGLRSRRSELVTMGFVHEVGTGKTKSGRPCAIWALKERKA